MGLLLGLGSSGEGDRGQTANPWDLEGLGNKPQALGTEPTGPGATGDLPTTVRGSGHWAGWAWGVKASTGQFILSLSWDGLAAVNRRVLWLGLWPLGPPRPKFKS